MLQAFDVQLHELIYYSELSPQTQDVVWKFKKLLVRTENMLLRTGFNFPDVFDIEHSSVTTEACFPL